MWIFSRSFRISIWFWFYLYFTFSHTDKTREEKKIDWIFKIYHLITFARYFVRILRMLNGSFDLCVNLFMAIRILADINSLHLPLIVDRLIIMMDTAATFWTHHKIGFFLILIFISFLVLFFSFLNLRFLTFCILSSHYWY